MRIRAPGYVRRMRAQFIGPPGQPYANTFDRRCGQRAAEQYRGVPTSSVPAARLDPRAGPSSGRAWGSRERTTLYAHIRQEHPTGFFLVIFSQITWKMPPGEGSYPVFDPGDSCAAIQTGTRGCRQTPPIPSEQPWSAGSMPSLPRYPQRPGGGQPSYRVHRQQNIPFLYTSLPGTPFLPCSTALVNPTIYIDCRR